jgi:hypothetical protein
MLYPIDSRTDWAHHPDLAHSVSRLVLRPLKRALRESPSSLFRSYPDAAFDIIQTLSAVLPNEGAGLLSALEEDFRSNTLIMLQALAQFDVEIRGTTYGLAELKSLADASRPLRARYESNHVDVALEWTRTVHAVRDPVIRFGHPVASVCLVRRSRLVVFIDRNGVKKRFVQIQKQL